MENELSVRVIKDQKGLDIFVVVSQNTNQCVSEGESGLDETKQSEG